MFSYEMMIFGISLVLAGLPILYIGVGFGHLPPKIPWFYSLPWGEERLISKEWMMTFFGCVFLVTVLNYFWASKLSSDLIAKRLIQFSGLVMNVLFLISFYQVISLIKL